MSPDDVPILTAAQIEAFHAKIDTTGDGCHLWTKGTNEGGYGIVRIGGRHYLAHRLAYFLATGEMPPSDVPIMHDCDTPPCCRISEGHGARGTTAQNTLDAIERGLRKYPERRGAVCGNGHVLTPDNIYIRPADDYPVCRICRATDDAASRRRPGPRAAKIARDRASHQANREKRLRQMRDRRKRIKEQAT